MVLAFYTQLDRPIREDRIQAFSYKSHVMMRLSFLFPDRNTHLVWLRQHRRVVIFRCWLNVIAVSCVFIWAEMYRQTWRGYVRLWKRWCDEESMGERACGRFIPHTPPDPFMEVKAMQIGMIGLGRMGANMVRRLMQGGHKCVIYDRNADTVNAISKEGAIGASSLQDFVSKLTPPRTAWLMVPAAVVDKMLNDLAPIMESGDIIIDGGNSYYVDDIRRADELKSKGLHYVDIGTSGGVWGLERGYCQMIGGETDIVKHLDPIFKTLAPGMGNIPRTPGRGKVSGTAENDYLHSFPSTP